MKELPGKFLQSLEGVRGFNKDAFVKVHESGEQVTSIRLNPAKGLNEDHSPLITDHSPFTAYPSPTATAAPVPWSQYGFYLPERPSFTFDPLFHAGTYYVQEASSMFLEQAFRQLVDLSTPLMVLDLCAAPGGKSTHIQSLICPGSLLVSNEIIRGRNNILIDNIIKWGCNNVVVSNNDPTAFQKLPGFFDVMVVDAPCSGSGLFRKDVEAIDEWSLNNIQLCSQRQRRILEDALSTLKEDGILIYCTCSYSEEEDEEIMDWLVDEFQMQTLPLNLAPDWNIIETTSSKTNAKGYRFYPNLLKGEGFFLACFRKTSSEREVKHRPSKLDKVSKKEAEMIEQWIKTEGGELFKENDSFFVLPSALINEYAILRYALNIRYKGVGLGQIMKDRLVPAHSLALSTLNSDRITSIDLSYEEAIKYLQRQDVNLNTISKGWQMVTFKGHKLGWINVLPNRVNNYYPKELRILKQQNDSAFEK